MLEDCENDKRAASECFRSPPAALFEPANLQPGRTTSVEAPDRLNYVSILMLAWDMVGAQIQLKCRPALGEISGFYRPVMP